MMRVPIASLAFALALVRCSYGQLDIDIVTYFPVAPSPPGTECTEYSLSYPAWRIEDLGIKRTATEGTVAFKATNTATGGVSECGPHPVSTWAECESTTDMGVPSTPLRFIIDSSNYTTWSLSLAETWICADMNPERL